MFSGLVTQENLGKIRKINPNGSPTFNETGKQPLPNAGTEPDREEDVPECSGPGISRILSGNIRFPGNGIRERRPLLNAVCGYHSAMIIYHNVLK